MKTRCAAGVGYPGGVLLEHERGERSTRTAATTTREGRSVMGSCPASLHRRIAWARKIAYDVSHMNSRGKAASTLTVVAEKYARQGQYDMARTTLRHAISWVRQALGRKR